MDFERLPAAGNYSPLTKSKQKIHTLSDGTKRTNTIRDNFSCKIKYKYISETFYDNLQSIYEAHEKFIFVPFGTSTSWDGVIKNVLWTKDWNFSFSDNVKTVGYSGNIRLEETL